MSDRHKISGVYKITAPDGRVYIGSSTDVMNRWCTYRNCKCKKQTNLLDSLLKYGPEKHIFEVIEKCEKDKLEQREYYYGMLFNVLDERYGLNSRLPKVEGSTVCVSKSMKEKIGNANSGRYVGMKRGFIKRKNQTLNSETITEIKKLLFENNLTEKEIAHRYNVSRDVIKNICTGTTYSYISPEYDLSKRVPTYIKINKEKDWEEIKNMYKNGISQRKIAKIFDVDPSRISQIINNKCN